MEFKRPPSDEAMHAWKDSISEDTALLMRVLVKLKQDYDEGANYFFEGMHDADGNLSPLISEDLPSILSGDDDDDTGILEKAMLPWDHTGEKIWAWDGAVYSLQYFLLNICDFDEETWTIDFLEETMEKIHNGHHDTKRAMESLAKSSDFEEKQLGFVVSCLADMAMHDDDDHMTDSWAVCCVLHKQSESLEDALFWTHERAKEALILVKPMVLDKEAVIT